MPQSIQFNSTPENKGVRLDMFLVDALGISRAQVQKLIHADLVTVNGKLPKKPGDPLNRDSAIAIADPDKEQIEEEVETGDSEMQDLHIEVLADEPEYIVIHKPAGLLVHPTDAHEQVTLTRWLLERYPEVATVGDDPMRPGIVHRLDREASGLMVVAKTQAMFEFLKLQFQNRTMAKEYIVLVHEVMERDHGIIDFAIDRGTDGRMASRPKIDLLSLQDVRNDQGGKDAITEYEVLKRFTRFTLLRVHLHTGRTHQIRVHMYAANHSVVGDTIYVNTKLNLRRDKKLGRLFLHAEKLSFDTREGERVSYHAPLPMVLEEFLKELN